MKAKKTMLIVCLALIAGFVSAQSTKTDEFKVLGNCNMCKNNIESSLKNVDGITSADWNVKTKMLKVSYDPAKISGEQINQKISDAGYDSERKKGSDKAYGKLPKCCQYDRNIKYKKSK